MPMEAEKPLIRSTVSDTAMGSRTLTRELRDLIRRKRRYANSRTSDREIPPTRRDLTCVLRPPVWSLK